MEQEEADFPDHDALSRRERQIMDIVYRMQCATANDIHQALPDAPSYSGVRALLTILENKGHLKHGKKGARYVFMPTRPRQTAAKSALKRVVDTFFGGSVEQAVSTLLTESDGAISDDEFEKLAQLVEEARERERSEK